MLTLRRRPTHLAASPRVAATPIRFCINCSNPNMICEAGVKSITPRTKGSPTSSSTQCHSSLYTHERRQQAQHDRKEHGQHREKRRGDRDDSKTIDQVEPSITGGEAANIGNGSDKGDKSSPEDNQRDCKQRTIFSSRTDPKVN